MVQKSKIKAMMKHTMPVVATVITSSKSSSMIKHPCCRMVCQGATRPKGRGCERCRDSGAFAGFRRRDDQAAADVAGGRSESVQNRRTVLSTARIGIGNLEGVESRCDQIGRPWGETAGTRAHTRA
jgi:hypothetical protein